MFDNDQLKEYLYTHIPLSQNLAIEFVTICSEKIVISAPLVPNINHQQTVFGGSLHAVTTLSCWSFLFVQLQMFMPLDILITSSHIQYLQPVLKDFQATCFMPDIDKWSRFIQTLERKGKARIALKSLIYQDEKCAVDYQGTFAALKK